MMLDTLVFRGSAATFRTMKGTYAGGPLSLYPLVGPYPSKSSVYSIPTIFGRATITLDIGPHF